MQDGLTALMAVAIEGHHKCVSILVAHGANINESMGVSRILARQLVNFANVITFYSTAVDL